MKVHGTMRYAPLDGDEYPLLGEAADGIQQHVAEVGHAAADGHHVGRDERDQIAQRDGVRPGNPVDLGRGEGVAAAQPLRPTSRR